MNPIDTLNFNEQKLNIIIEQKVLKYINMIRQKPQNFIKILEDYQLDFEDNQYLYKKFNKRIRTREGTTAIYEGIKYLNESDPIIPLEVENKLNNSAKQHLDYLVEKSKIDHLDEKGNDAEFRIKNVMGKGSTAECIIIQEPKAKHLVINLFLDDGLYMRPNRRVLLSNDLKSFGMAIKQHPKTKWMAILHFHGPPEAKFTYKFPENKLDEEPWPDKCNYLEKILYKKYEEKEVYTKIKYNYKWPDVEGSERYQQVEENKEAPIKFKINSNL